MTGFRSGTSGSLIQRAKAAGRAIGKRRAEGGPVSKSPTAGFQSSRFPFFPLLRSSPPLQKYPDPQRPEPFNKVPLRSGQDTALNPPPLLAAVSEVAEIWKEYHAFKAAGLLTEWRRRWVCYLAIPA